MKTYYVLSELICKCGLPLFVQLKGMRNEEFVILDRSELSIARGQAFKYANSENRRNIVFSRPISVLTYAEVSVYPVSLVPPEKLVMLSDYNEKGYNPLCFERNGYDFWGYDVFGYNREGIDRDGFNREGYNNEGFDRQGFNRDGYDKYGFDHKGFDKDGYDRFGFNDEGFDRQGFDIEGYDEFGYDFEGFDRDGFDRDGINRWGFDRYGDDARFPFRDKDGYDRGGFDSQGYNRQGFDSEGFDREGFNSQGYDRWGYTRRDTAEWEEQQRLAEEYNRQMDYEIQLEIEADRYLREYKNSNYGYYEEDELDDYGMPLYEDYRYEDGPPEPEEEYDPLERTHEDDEDEYDYDEKNVDPSCFSELDDEDGELPF